MPRLNRMLRLSLAALLLAAWQSALMHPLVHVNSDGGFVHVGGGKGSQAPGEKKLPNLLCDAMAAVAACVAGSGSTLAVAPQFGEQSFLSPVAALIGARPPAYRSQAPPSLL
jgi:hypothetical protein